MSIGHSKCQTTKGSWGTWCSAMVETRTQAVLCRLAASLQRATDQKWKADSLWIYLLAPTSNPDSLSQAERKLGVNFSSAVFCHTSSLSGGHDFSPHSKLEVLQRSHLEPKASRENWILGETSPCPAWVVSFSCAERNWPPVSCTDEINGFLGRPGSQASAPLAVIPHEWCCALFTWGWARLAGRGRLQESASRL